MPTSIQQAIPAFGKALRTPDFYFTVDGIILVLRPMSTLRTIATHLNGLGIRTASGLEWNRERVAQYIRHRNLISTTFKE
jgi:hypothetical protein